MTWYGSQSFTRNGTACVAPCTRVPYGVPIFGPNDLHRLSRAPGSFGFGCASENYDLISREADLFGLARGHR